MDLEKLAKKQGIDLGALMNANQADPSQSLAHADGVERRARHRVTTGFAACRRRTTRFNIDLKQLANDNKAFRQLARAADAATVVDSYPAEAWIDDTGPRPPAEDRRCR